MIGRAILKKSLLKLLIGLATLGCAMAIATNIWEHDIGNALIALSGFCAWLVVIFTYT